MSIDWKIVPDTNDNLQIGVDWHEEQNDDYYFISPEIYRYDYYYTDNSGGNYWETLYINENETNEWGPYSWGSGSGERSIDTFATYTYTRKDSDYDIYLTISWDNSTGAVYNGSFNYVPEGSFNFWITIPAKEITKKTVTLEYYSDENTLWRTESKEIPLNTTTNVYFPKVKPIKDGYKFAGWKIDNTTYIKDEYFPVASSNNTIKIYAQWTKICIVSFIYNDGDKINIEKTFRLTAGSTIDLNKEFGVQSKATKETIEHTYKIQTNPNDPSSEEIKTAKRITTTTKEFIDWKSTDGDGTEKTTNGIYTVTKDIKFNEPIWTNIRSGIVDESITLPTTKSIISEEMTIPFEKEIEEIYNVGNNEPNKNILSLWFKGEQEVVLYSAIKIKRKVIITNLIKKYNEIKRYKWEVSEDESFSSSKYLLSPETICKVDSKNNKTFYVRRAENAFTDPVETNVRIEKPESPIYKPNSEKLLGIYLTPNGKNTKTNKFSGWIYNGELIEPGTEYYLSISNPDIIKDSEKHYTLGSKDDPKLAIKLTSVNFQPQILNFTLTRCKSDGSLDDDGVYAKITGTLVQTQPYADGSNSETITQSIKVNNETLNFEENSSILYDYSGSPQPFSYILHLAENGGFLVDSQYKVEITFEGSDNIWSVSATDYLTQSFFTIDLLAGGTGLAIGAPSSSSGFINNMETSCTQGFAIYPPQKKDDDRNIVVTGGRNLIKQSNFADFVATITISETETYSISSNGIKFEVYKNGSINPTPSKLKEDADTSKWTNSLSKDDKIEIKPIATKDVDKKNFQKTLKMEKGPSCSAYTPAPEDGATFFVDKDQINLLNSSITIKKDDANNIILENNKDISLKGINIFLKNGTLKAETGASIIATSATNAQNAKTAESAETATKLSTSNVGVNNKTPIYFSGGKPVAWTTPIADYIVAQGKCDFWTYRMWASGVAECWGQTSQVTFNFTEQWGSIHQTAYQQNSFPGGSTSYPFSETVEGVTYHTLFNVAPSMINIQFIGGGTGDIIGVSMSSGMTAKKTCKFNFQRPDTASVTGCKAFYALGTWK